MGMSGDNLGAALLHLPLLDRSIEVPQADVVLQLVGSPRRFETGITIDGTGLLIQMKRTG